MKKPVLSVALCAIVISVFALPSHAALIGVLPATPGDTDWQAYYDDDADVTWLQNASASGLVDWAAAETWVTTLDIDGVTGWRLPDTPQPDPSCDSQSSGIGFGSNCTGSDMGNLFYNVLGGVAGSSIVTTHNSNYDLFAGIAAPNLSFWSTAVGPDHATYFGMNDGSQFNQIKTVERPAWAVHDGNVGVVPVPAAVWLFGSALGLLGWVRRKAT